MKARASMQLVWTLAATCAACNTGLSDMPA